MNNPLLSKTEEVDLALTCESVQHRLENADEATAGRDGDGDVERTGIDDATSASNADRPQDAPVAVDDDGSNGKRAGDSTDRDSASGTDDDDDENAHKIVQGDEKKPWSRQFVGIPVNYFCVGVVLSASVSILYPLLIIKEGVSSSFYAAAASLVTLFWSYKVVFGFLSDCFPIRGQKWKPYIGTREIRRGVVVVVVVVMCVRLDRNRSLFLVFSGTAQHWLNPVIFFCVTYLPAAVLGWGLCTALLVGLAFMGESVTPTNLVIMLWYESNP